MSDDKKRAIEEKARREKARKEAELKKRKRKNRAIIISVIIVILIIIAGIFAVLYKKTNGDFSTLFNKTTNNANNSSDDLQADSTDNSIDNSLDNTSDESASNTSGVSVEDIKSVSSLVENAIETGAFVEEDAGINTTIKLSFVGDCMLASYEGEIYEGNFNWYANNYPTTYFMDEVRDIFEADDFTIANCENVFSDEKLPKRDKPWTPSFWFISKAANANIFRDNSIEAVTIANNHYYDYKEQGAEDTKAALDAAGVQWGLDDKIVYLEKDGYVISVICVSFCGFHGGGGDLEEAKTKLPYLEMAKENSDFQVLYFHGGVEKSLEVAGWVEEMSKIYIDNGCDLIIGAHPHVLQPLGQYNGVDIAYSLGNFCYGGHSSPKNRTIIYQYTIEVTDGEVTAKEYNIIPCYVYTGSTNNWQPKPIEDEEKIERVMQFLNGERSDPY